MKKFTAIVLLSLLPFAANAEWVGGVGYVNLSDDDGGIDVSLDAIAASIGYRFASENDFFLMPEFRIGIGVGDDTVLGVNVEVESLLAFSVRGQYDFASGAYVYAAPSYANLDLKATSGSVSASEDDWEFGFGAGFGYRFTDTVSGELSYETYDGTDVIGVAAKFWFK